MPRNPVVLIHGYSDTGRSFERWAELLRDNGYDTIPVAACTYQTLTNEVTIRDVAEGFDRALRLHPELKDENQPFDAIVHSTGMLVIRAWLTAYGRDKQRRSRLKRLIGLAPATFGSPLAHKGRSWIGSVFKGNKELGPDFLEAGDLVLDALELGSRYTWNLANTDLFGDMPFYGPDADTPYIFVLCGDQGYGGIRGLVNERGMDGTVRWAGCSLDARKVTIDLTQQTPLKDRLTIDGGTTLNAPLYLMPDHNHATILTKPSSDLARLVIEALGVDSQKTFLDWSALARAIAVASPVQGGNWQQFVVRAIDEREDPITDYHLQLITIDDSGVEHELPSFDLDVHAYAADKSYRCFHAEVTELQQRNLKNLWVRVMASTGSQLIAYWGHGADRPKETAPSPADWDARLDISEVLIAGTSEFFRPFTTMLVELRLNREPLPLPTSGGSIYPLLCRLDPPGQKVPTPGWRW